MFRRPLAPLAMVLLLALPVTAWAAPKVALTAIDGDSESEVRDAVAEALDGDELKLVSKKETNRAVDKLGDLSELSEKSAKKLAKDLAADAIVIGSLDKDGAARVLKFKLYVNGKAKKGFSIKFKNASSPKFKEALKKKMVEKLEGAAEAGGGGDEKVKKPGKGEDDEDPIGKKPKKGEKPGKPDDKAEKVAKGPKKGEKTEGGEPEEAAEKGEKGEKTEGESDEAPKSKGEGDDEEAPSKGAKDKKTASRLEGDDEEIGIRKGGRGVVAPKGRPANHAAIRLQVGGSTTIRRLAFASNLPANKAPQPFAPTPVPGARIEAELYPIALGNPYGIASGLGIAAHYDRTLTMKVNTSLEMGVDVPVAQFRYAVGPRLRIVGRSATSPSVTLGVDLGRSRFKPDRSVLMEGGNLDLPDTYYRYISPNLGFRIPIVASVAFMANGGALIIQDAGQIVRSYSYGQAKVLGVEAQAGLDLVFGKFGVRLTGEFTQIGYQFQGAGGTQANGRDGDPTTRDVGGAADRLFGGAVTFGVAY